MVVKGGKMKDLIITIDCDTRKVKFSRDFIGLTGENLQGNIIVDFEKKADFVDGTASFEVEQSGEKYAIVMTKDETNKVYTLPIKLSLLRYACTMKCQVTIQQEETANGIPVFKTEIFKLPCYEAINATNEIYDDYPYLANRELIGHNENGDSIYRDTFFDGTTATFIAPKGDKGEKGEIGDRGDGAVDVLTNYIDYEFVDGCYVNGGGVIATHNSYSYARFAPRFAKIIEIPTFFSSEASVVFRNEIKVLSYYKQTGTVGENKEFEIPEQCTEVLISCMTKNKGQFYIKTQTAGIVKNIEEDTKENYVSKVIDITPSEWTHGTLVNGLGKESEASDYSCTDFIPIFPFTSVTALNTARSEACWTFYDVNKNVINYYQNKDASTIGSMLTMETGGAYYIRFSGVKSWCSKFTAYCTYSPQVLRTLPERLAGELPYLKPNDRPLPVEDMPANCGYMAIFDRIGVVGDSLASGEMAYGGSVDESTTNYVDMYEYSWLQFIARWCGSTGYNFSKGGLSTRTFLSDVGGQLGKMNNAENKCKCYFIALGHNDKNQGVPIGTANDIDLTNYNNNADTYYGNYAGIIQRIKAIEPNAIIFPITMKPKAFETGGYNTAVRYMAEIFDNVYVLDMYQYYRNIPEWHYTEGHGNIMGYSWYAKELICYVDWIVRNNHDKFKYVQFIGTDKAQYIPETL